MTEQKACERKHLSLFCKIMGTIILSGAAVFAWIEADKNSEHGTIGASISKINDRLTIIEGDVRYIRGRMDGTQVASREANEPCLLFSVINPKE